MSGASPSFPYRLVATDLDGTLLRDDHSVSPRTREALAAAAAAGAAHIVVTGRAVPWTRPILEDLGYEGLAVCGQGAQVYDSGAGRLLTSVTLDRQLAGVALAKIEAEVGPLHLAASRDGLDGEVLVGPGYDVIGELLYDAVHGRLRPVGGPAEQAVHPAPRADLRRAGRGGRAHRGWFCHRRHGGRGHRRAAAAGSFQGDRAVAGRPCGSA